MDIMSPGIASLQFLSYYKIIDYIISQKLAKNIIIKFLCPFDEDSTRLTETFSPIYRIQINKTIITQDPIIFLVIH